MWNHNGIRSLRRATVSKLFATLIVVLAVSPFTAPFSTFDLTELPGNTAVHQGALTGDNTVKEVSAIDLIVPVAAHLSSSGVLLEAAGLTVDTDRRQALPIVLRL